VLCTLIAWLAPLAQYQNFLLLIGSVFAPLFGVVLVDHFILRRRAGAGIRRTALGLAAGLGGRVITYHLLANSAPTWGDPAGAAGSGCCNWRSADRLEGLLGVVEAVGAANHRRGVQLSPACAPRPGK
jgi:purine-cytosine permease-like protein